MMMTLTLLLLALAPPDDGPLAQPPALWQRAEPSLVAGARSLADGDVDAAIEHFRRAQPKSDDERAIVEYDVGAALLTRAALAAAEPPAGSTPSTHAAPPPAPPTPNAPGTAAAPDTSALDDARATFERAYGIAKDRRLKSEAALASGNAAAIAGKLDDAIADYRKAVVADPGNARAKTNLKRALAAKRAQPPPPPPPPDQGEGDDDKKPPQDKKPEDEKGDDKKPKDEKGGDDKKPEEGKSGAAQPEQRKKEEARRLLEMMRARERPLTPMDMRGTEKKQQPKQGKDW